MSYFHLGRIQTRFRIQETLYKFAVFSNQRLFSFLAFISYPFFHSAHFLVLRRYLLKVHKRENFLGSDIEICTFS